MWKKLISLNLALLMCLTLISPAWAFDYKVVFHRNQSPTDTETESRNIDLSSEPDLKLYAFRNKFENSGNVLTSYRSGTGTNYVLTDRVAKVAQDYPTQPAHLYAQWTSVKDNYMFYIGESVGLAADGKDYIIEDGLSGKVKLKGEDAFQHLSSTNKIIGWRDSKHYNEYYPGQEITIDSNLTLFPITGYNYVTYQFRREEELKAKETEFYKFATDADKPVGMLEISDGAIYHSHKADKVFSGWKAREDGVGPWYTGLAKDAPHKLYAQMEDFPTSGEYCILYSKLGVGKDDDRIGITLPLANGKITGLSDDPTDRYGYVFKGWYTEEYGKGTKVENGTSLYNGQIIYAYWSKKSSTDKKEYTITFHANGGEFSDGGTSTALTVKEGETLDNLPVATYDGCAFCGWFYTPDAGMNDSPICAPYSFTEDTELYAVWIDIKGYYPPPYDITFFAEGGKFPSGGTSINLKTDNNGMIVNWPSDPIRSGYTFDFWYINTSGDPEFGNVQVNQHTIFPGSAGVYAHWKPDSGTPSDKVHIIIIEGGGSISTGSDGRLPSLPAAPSKPGYIFDGWYTGPNGSGDRVDTDYIFTGPVTIYPSWKPDSGKPSDKVHIIIIEGGGSISTGSDGRLPSLPAAPSRPGYIFDGWYTGPNGSGDRVDTDYIFTGPVTIYPSWRPEGSSTAYYRIYTPGRVYGGSYDVSHTIAVPGTRVAIELDPWSGYELDWLSAVNLDTGRELTLHERYWDEYTFTMPYGDVEIELFFAEEYVRGSGYYPSYGVVSEAPVQQAGPYVWYYKDRHIYHITDGMVADHTPITRDMFLSVLYNLSGNTGGGGKTIGSETNDAQAWATNERLIPDIYASGLWGLDKPLSRDQTAMLLFRYAGYRGFAAAPELNLTRYADYSRVRPIARNGLSWALSAGLMTNTAPNRLSPQDAVTCGQAGDLLFRFQTGVAKVW